jgi:hypothetical protein
MSKGSAICLQQTTATDPARIDAQACTSVDVIFDSDVAGSNYDASLTVYQCATPGVAQAEPSTITDCEALAPSGVVAPLTGNPTGNLDAIYGISPRGGFLAFRLLNANSRNIYTRVVCH